MRKHRMPILLAVSAAGLLTIATHEGTVLKAYPDPVGIPTICVGHTKGVVLGQKRTQSECDLLLKEDASIAGKAVARCTKVAVTQEQYDVLVSFTFNVGESAYCSSTLVKKLNAGDCFGAGHEFGRWVYAKGRKLPGLVNRRADDRKKFETGCEVDVG